jgi:hypothetical protein
MIMNFPLEAWHVEKIRESLVHLAVFLSGTRMDLTGLESLSR